MDQIVCSPLGGYAWPPPPGGALPLTLAATEGNLVYGDRELVNLPRNTR
jgi:hypothetical protein